MNALLNLQEKLRIVPAIWTAHLLVLTVVSYFCFKFIFAFL